MQNILFNPRAFATPLLLYIVNELGSDAFGYEPETIAEFIKKRNPNASKGVIDRANAALGLFTSNLFWYDPIVFCGICRTLNRHRYPTNNEPSLDDIAWGMSEVRLIMGDNDEENKDQYSFSIDSYVNLLLKEAGIYDVPNSMEGVHAPSINSTIDDSDQLMSIQQRSDEEKNSIDMEVNDKLAEMLRQIVDMQLPLSKQAQDELNKLLGADNV